MRKQISIILMFITTLIFNGCDVEKTVYIDTYPAAPTGLTSVTGDSAVYLYWYAVGEDDIESYGIYRNTTGPANPFVQQAIISESNISWVDYEVSNGITYYYAITAIDELGQESDLSGYIHDTPRPEGDNVTIYDDYDYYSYSGFDLYAGERIPWDDSDCDFYIDYDSFYDAFFITVRYDEYYIQDFGFVEYFDDVSYAPEHGWSGFNNIEAIEGHMYILKLWHFQEWHYARIWVKDLNTNPASMTFAWAYQIDDGNRELVINPDAVKYEPDVSIIE